MWQPTANLDTLKKRAQLLSNCRSFFSQRGVMEIDVPILGRTGVSDPNIECLKADVFTLQSSPEYYMKRLLAHGSGDIYYLGKAFRKEEAGAKHSPEFTMLEWYRLGQDDRRLALEVVDLLCAVAGQHLPYTQGTYADYFFAATGLNPHDVEVEELEAFARSTLNIQFTLPDKSAWLDLLFSHCVEPGFDGSVNLVFDYPVCQSALARRTLDIEGRMIARRFEVFWKGLELANGYWELCDVDEQKKRFECDLESRRAQGKFLPELDAQFLAALEAGLPNCAGVALGLDRLLMCLSGEKNIAAVQAFSIVD